MKQNAKGVVMIPGDQLEALALDVKLLRSEWRIMALVLAAPGPVSARQLAKNLGTAYGPIKRTVRALVAWRILDRTPRGLVFQPNAKRWGPPRDKGTV